MKHLLFIYCILSLFGLQAQISHIDSLSKKQKAVLGGMVAYYFWEEDSSGRIIPKSLERPFRRNEIVVTNAEIKAKDKVTSEKLLLAVSQLSHNNSRDEKRFFKTHPKDDDPDVIYLPLRKRTASEATTVQYRLKSGVWECATRKNVVYFNVFSDSSKRYSHSNDSVVLPFHQVALKAQGHYFVKTFWNAQQQIVAQQVYAYNGDNVSDYFKSLDSVTPKRLLLFVNGYRGPKRNRDVSDGLVTKRDRYWYWMKLDKMFVKAIKPDAYYYLDGSHHIKTSNHRTKANFGLSYSRIKALKKKPANATQFDLLNRDPNIVGFVLRMEKGFIAAQAFQTLRCGTPYCEEVKDTVDLVCHSMGYAYAIGFLEALRGQVVFGKIYIIAPENACTEGMDWSEFEEVWQYGSNLDQPNPDPVWQQDGIAPQCEVKDLHKAKVGGRVFFPPSVKKKNFIDSHLLKQYHWIIKDIKEGEAGYVQR